MSPKISIEIEKCTGRKPLYHQYPGQSSPQPAHIYLDCERERLWADWDGEIGNAVPARVWHGRVLRAHVSPYLPCYRINKLLKDILPLAKSVCEGYECHWNGQNHEGRLTRAAQDAWDLLERKAIDTY